MPIIGFESVKAPRGNLLGPPGQGLSLASKSFTGATALVGIFGVALMRAAFEFALHFSRTERRGGIIPIIEHQAVGYALADAKTAIEAARHLSWAACRAIDTQSPRADELAIEAKIFGSETAVRVITNLMQVVGVESYDQDGPLAGLLLDALALPHLGGGNFGVKRRQLHSLLKNVNYDPIAEGLDT
jgi:butyryl-CoA dehydrogenase